VAGLNARQPIGNKAGMAGTHRPCGCSVSALGRPKIANWNAFRARRPAARAIEDKKD